MKSVSLGPQADRIPMTYSVLAHPMLLGTDSAFRPYCRVPLHKPRH